MKKILSLLLALIMILSLASCNDSEQKVIVKNDKGENVEVVLKATDDKETVKNALAYVAQADYSNLELFNLSLNSNASLKLSDDLMFAGKANLSFGAEYNEEHNQATIYGEGALDILARYPNSTEPNIIDQNQVAINGILAAELNLDLINILNDNVYLGGTLKENGTSTSKKIKMTVGELVEIIKNNIGGEEAPASYDLPSAPNMPEVPSLSEIQQMLDELQKEFPNTIISISKVAGKSFTLNIKISLKDILNKLDPEIAKKLENDLTITFDYEFDLASGRLLNVKLSLDTKALLDFVFDSGLLAEVEGAVKEEAEFKLEFNLNIRYDGEAIHKLTEAEKNEYYELI